ncbi:unnamed protein product [Ostreobium quekettii]|uniref:Mitochondrial transcription termination factor n=1 Tax=Ostreobium quekettii TaxID=121088 RepID=A0A8S1J9F6_9CHLO|nr:unnamed protein product [Ostreobium quekettii]
MVWCLVRDIHRSSNIGKGLVAAGRFLCKDHMLMTGSLNATFQAFSARSKHVRAPFAAQQLPLCFVHMRMACDECKASERSIEVRSPDAQMLGKEVLRDLANTRAAYKLSKQELQVVNFFFSTLKLSYRGVRAILQRCPQVLRLSLKNAIVPRLALFGAQGLSWEDIGPVLVGCPELLLIPAFEGNLKIFADYAKSEMGASKDEFVRLLQKEPSLLLRSVERDIVPKVAFFRDLGGPPRTTMACLVQNPRMLTYSLEDQLKPCLSFLTKQLHIPKDEYMHLLKRRPSLMGFSVDYKLVPKLQYFATLGLSPNDVGKMAVKFPAVLTANLNRKVEVLVQFLVSDLKIPEGNIGAIIKRMPSLVTNSMESNRSRHEYYLGLGLSSEDVGKMVLEFPQVLGNSLSGEMPTKVQFLQQEMEKDLEELVKFPYFLNYSFRDRIVPRAGFLKIVKGRKGIKDVSLFKMYYPSDAKFCKNVVERPQKEFERYRACLWATKLGAKWKIRHPDDKDAIKRMCRKCSEWMEMGTSQ